MSTKTKCCGTDWYAEPRNPTLREIREKKIPLELMTQPEYQEIEIKCSKCKKLCEISVT